MATIQVVGGSAVTATSTRNDGGTIKNLRTQPASSRWDGQGVESVGAQQGSIPVQSSSLGVQKAVTGNNFATMTDGKFVILGHTRFLGGVANTTLNSTGQPQTPRNSVHRLATTRVRNDTTAFVSTTGAYNMITDTFSAGMPTTSGYTIANETAESRSVPGEFAYKGPAPAPVQADYKAATLGL
jgi:hypothetical protein